MSGRSSESGRARHHRQKMFLWRRQDRICPWCGLPITVAEFEYATRDHWRPKSHGGPEALWNLRLLHGGCNNRKGSICPDVECDYGGHAETA